MLVLSKHGIRLDYSKLCSGNYGITRVWNISISQICFRQGEIGYGHLGC